jgi:hypothetical protein
VPAERRFRTAAEQGKTFYLAGISLIFVGILLTRRDARPTT